MFAQKTIGRWLCSFVICVSELVASYAVADETSNAPEKEAKPYPEGINCVWLPSLRSQFYSLIDDQHLVLEGTPKKFYLLTFTRRCRDLDTTLDIGLETHGNQLCSNDSIITDSDRCTIQYLEEVANYEEARQIVRDRAAAEKGGN